MRQAPRCGARTRSGKPCQAPGMPNGRCRMHGGPSPGAPKGNKNAFKHGYYSTRAMLQRREIAALIREMREQCTEILEAPPRSSS
ncbi:HGGxSTG domain-containing protein [Bradyrhizobium sp. Arg816]|uniref:HGGxSTG domain-containing protein n=1 Tax=Bradyrhizobium sp. Arg816 TaxID=2998491 RepID=UPI00249E7A51|nr:HGGxSTG domain-containing protein [Bradyrhizobium sp. Arg816]